MPALTTIVDGAIWATERPVWFSGVRLRARTTVVRMDDGGLLVHSPAPPTDALVAALAALGPVRWLMVPNCFHHLGTPAAAARYPEARVVGPASASSHNQALRIDVDLADPAFAAQVPELELLPVGGVPFLDETVVFHRPTGSLLGADVVLRADADDHWTWRFAARVMGCYERLRVPPDVKKKIVDREAAARSIAAIVARPARRLIVAHAAVVEDGCGDQLADAWRRVGVAV